MTRWTRRCWIISCGGLSEGERRAARRQPAGEAGTGGLTPRRSPNSKRTNMGFVQASMLAALAAVILPILAHLLFRRRSRPVDLGTLRFLKVAVRQETRRRWLKRWLLLVLRLACVVLLVFLFARPFRAEFVGGGDAG